MANEIEQNNQETAEDLELAKERWMLDSSVREKMDGRMVASWGPNLALNKPIRQFYPEDKEKLVELFLKGDDKGVCDLKNELIAQGRYYYKTNRN